MDVKKPAFWVTLIISLCLYAWGLVHLIDYKCSLHTGVLNPDFLLIGVYIFYLVLSYCLLTSIVAKSTRNRIFAFLLIFAIGSFFAYYSWFMITRELCPELWFESFL